jgi:Ca2+-binding EF-hand superfamily protein
MPLPLFVLPILAAAAAPAPIVVTGHGWAPFISPMGEPFRSHGPDDDTVADWFRQADLNHDGYLTAQEMEADAERFFRTLDTNHDGQIDPDELVHYEWEVAPEIQVNSRQRRRRGDPAPPATGENDRGWLGGETDEDRGKRRHREDESDGGPMGAARYSLLNIPEPVAAADADFNRAITLEEFRQAALDRFQLLDKNHEGKLSLQELEAMLPPPPTPGKKPKRPKNALDTRYGLPVPPGPNEPCNDSSC